MYKIIINGAMQDPLSDIGCRQIWRPGVGKCRSRLSGFEFEARRHGAPGVYNYLGESETISI